MVPSPRTVVGNLTSPPVVVRSAPASIVRPPVNWAYSLVMALSTAPVVPAATVMSASLTTASAYDIPAAYKSATSPAFSALS